MRRLWAVIAATPAVLVLLFWINSYFPGYDWQFRSDDGRLFAFSVTAVGRQYLKEYAGAEVWMRLERGPLKSELTSVSLLGVRFIAHGEGSHTEPFVALSVPYPYLVVPALLPPMVVLDLAAAATPAFGRERLRRLRVRPARQC